MTTDICELCDRETLLTKHHLVPRSCHTKRRKIEFGNKINVTANLCRDCHSKVHATEKHKDLADKYNTVKSLKNHPEIKKFIKWIQKQNINNRFRSRKMV